MVDILKDGVTIFHGSYCEVKVPDLGKCAKYKDFGKGFYLTTDKEQARSFSRLSTKKAKDNGLVDTSQEYGIVSSYVYHESGSMIVKVFEDADADWLHCIVAHRKRNAFPKIVSELQDYDIIGGKIANDATNATILAYMAGTFGKIGSRDADEVCIRLLLPNRLDDQYCFRTESAVSTLEFLNSEKVWI